MNAEPERIVLEAIDRVELDEQIEEALNLVADAMVDMGREVAAGICDEVHAMQRIKRRNSILGTLQWLRDNRAAVIEVSRKNKRQEPTRY